MRLALTLLTTVPCSTTRKFDALTNILLTPMFEKANEQTSKQANCKTRPQLELHTRQHTHIQRDTQMDTQTDRLAVALNFNLCVI